MSVIGPLVLLWFFIFIYLYLFLFILIFFVGGGGVIYGHGSHPGHGISTMLMHFHFIVSKTLHRKCG